MAEFCEWAGDEGTLIFGRFRILVPLLVRVVVKSGKCWQVKVDGEWVLMDCVECVDKRVRDVWIGC